MKSAILVVSFGTTHLDTLRENISRTEASIADAFPNWPFYRAFTSPTVRRRLSEQYGIVADSVEEAMARMASDGVERVVLQPTLLIPGEEYDKLCAAVQASAGSLTVSIGRPLLCGEPDLREMTDALRAAYPVDSGTVLLLMGHGTEHRANSIYEQLAGQMRALEGTTMRLCTVEGSPTFADAVAELSSLPQRKVLAAPLMLVAGDHAKHDMAGDAPDSLCSLLTAAGLQVSCALQGLGQLKAVREMYVRRALEAAEAS